MASNKNNPQIPPQQFDKSSSDQVIQPDDPNAIAQQQKYILSRYWDYKRQQMAAATKDDLKKREFPLSRIKKIMTADEDVRMVSSEAPILFAKACEFFIQELTIKSWLIADHSGRQTIRKDDIVEVITNETDYYDFLFDVVGGGSSSSHADPGAVASSSSVPPMLPSSGDGVLVLPPAVQRWIRYGDENEMNEGPVKEDEMNVETNGGEQGNEMNIEIIGGEEKNEMNVEKNGGKEENEENEMNGGEEENEMNVEKNGGEEENEMNVDGAAN